jgi:putative helicase MOV10L1/helicase MOV-10
MNVFCGLGDNTINTGYESYFRYHLEAEIQSQKLENESYSLFGHDVTTLTHDTSGTTCSFLASEKTARMSRKTILSSFAS